MTDLSKLLNAEQLEAATAPDGPLLVLAAAGTGKTRTLVYRVVHLIERGTPAQEIMLLTFTNRAAREMLERAEAATNGVISGLWGGTFHHVANRILRKYAPRVGFRRDFAILDAEDQKSVLGACIKGCGFKPKEFPRREAVLSLISGAANRGIDFADYIEDKAEAMEVPADQIMQVADAYSNRKTGMGAMDFDDLLVKSLYLLREDSEVRTYYQERFKHILVDEYQDTNILQSEFIDILSAGYRNLSVVGDDFQCIYSWRGSNYENIMNFPERYPDVRIVKLEQNYRSRPEILRIANESIKHNEKQFKKTLRPTRESNGVKPLMYDVYSDREQSDRTLEAINSAVAAGYSYNDIAILYRAHFHSLDIELSLGRAQIPYAITSGLGFFEQAHVKDVLSLMRLAVFPSEFISFSRIMSLLPGVGAATVERIWKNLGSVFEAGKSDHRANLLALLPAKAVEEWKPVSDALGKFVEDDSKKIPGAVSDLVSGFVSSFYRKHLERQYENAEERHDEITELVVDMQRNPDIREYLANIALLTNVDREGDRKTESSENKPHVLLSTVHQAKGLEWPVVIIIWLVEGMFPSSRAIEEDPTGAEERRLFYVAATRAKDRLHMMVPRKRYMHDGGQMDCLPSRFLRELPDGLVDEVKSSYGYPQYMRGPAFSYRGINRGFIRE